MHVLLTGIRTAVSIGALASFAHATTWIVDASGGPGVNFTDIPPAIAAASPGDVIFVRAGNYSPFALGIGVAIIGTPGVYPNGTQINSSGLSTISVPAGQIAVCADFRARYDVSIQSSAGTVVLDRLEVWSGATVTIAQSADVRISRQAGGAVSVSNSTFEISSSTVVGRSDNNFSGANGGNGLSVSGASSGLVTRTSCSGGWGGDSPWLPANGGNGGHGIELTASGGVPILLLAGGGASTIRGGGGGFSSWWPTYPDGRDGDGLHVVHASDWRSGCAFSAGYNTGIGGVPIYYSAGPGTFDTPIAPDDPTLELGATVAPGGAAQLTTYATPGSVVRLVLGATPIHAPTPGVRVDKLVSAEHVLFVGRVPGNGSITQLVNWRNRTSLGTVYYAQAYVIDPVAGETRRTNSVPIVVR